jgi:hypothetical protein
VSARRPKWWFRGPNGRTRYRHKLRDPQRRKDERVATAELVPVRNHRVRTLCVQLPEAILVRAGGFFPIRTDDGRTAFATRVHWPEGTPCGGVIRLKDWVDVPMHSTIDLSSQRTDLDEEDEEDEGEGRDSADE